MNYGFVINNETCIGCHACATACKSENEVPLGVDRGSRPTYQPHPAERLVRAKINEVVIPKRAVFRKRK